MKITQQLESIIRWVARLGGYIAAVAIVAMMMVTVVDVVLRFFFNSPLMGSIEISEYIMVVLSFLAMAYCAIEGGHVTVDLVVSLLKKKTQIAWDVFGYVSGLVLFIPMTLVFIPEAIEVYQMGDESEVLYIPAFPFYIVVIVGCAFISLVLAIELVKSIQRLAEK